MYEELLSFGIKLLESYKGAKLHHMMECQFCFHQWSSTPTQKKQSFRLNGTNGCPNCIGCEVKDVVLDPVVLEPLITIDQPALKKWLSDHKDERIAISDQTGFLPENARVRQRIWHIVNGKDVPLCKGCNTEHVSWHMQENRYRDFCGSACSHKDPEVKKNLGTEKGTVTKEKLLERVNRKHGTQYTSLKAAHAELYAHLHTSTRERAPTMTPAEHAFRRWKLKNPNLPEYMYTDLRDPEKFKEINSRLNLEQICEEYHIPRPTLLTIVARHGIKPKQHFTSSYERKIQEFLTELSIDHTINDRTVLSGNRELDIVCPSNNLAIEVNGIFYHGEVNGKKGRQYHLQKTLLCGEQGYNLMHFMDSEIRNKWPIVQSMIRSKLGKSEYVVYARNCEVVEVNVDIAKEFFERCHISGFAGATTYLALMWKGQPVTIMSFGKARFNKTHQWELVRLASELGFSVVGGASKLLKTFIGKYDPTSIVSYADRRFSADGNVYKKIGFQLLHESPPNYWYFKTSDARHVMSRQVFQKHKLESKLDFFDPALSEWENMVANGYDRIWDCGNLVFSWKKQNPLV